LDIGISWLVERILSHVGAGQANTTQTDTGRQANKFDQKSQLEIGLVEVRRAYNAAEWMPDRRRMMQ
jgi:hypothetical protein